VFMGVVICYRDAIAAGCRAVLFIHVHFECFTFGEK
jgi:hypothetical protein